MSASLRRKSGTVVKRFGILLSVTVCEEAARRLVVLAATHGVGPLA